MLALQPANAALYKDLSLPRNASSDPFIFPSECDAQTNIN